MIIICSFINYKFAIIGTFGSPFCMPSAIVNNVCDYFYFFLGQFTRNYTQTTKRVLLTTNKG